MLARHEAELPELRDRLSDCEPHLANLTGQAHAAFSGLAELRAIIDADRLSDACIKPASHTLELPVLGQRFDKFTCSLHDMGLGCDKQGADLKNMFAQCDVGLGRHRDTLNDLVDSRERHRTHFHKMQDTCDLLGAHCSSLDLNVDELRIRLKMPCPKAILLRR